MGKSAEYCITREKFLDEDERSKLLKTCIDRAELDLLHGRRTWVTRYMLVDLALFTGLRVAELAALKLKDVHLTVKDPYLIVRNGKRGKTRDVYLDKGLVRHLKTYIRQKRTWDEAIDPDAPLFAGRNGQHSPTITLMKSFKRAIEEAGLPDHYSIHSARHTYATFLLRDSKNLQYVRKQLGHTQIAMTALYADVLPSENGNLANMIRRD